MFFSLLIIQYVLFNKNQTQCSTIAGLENLSIHDYKNNDEIIKRIGELNMFFITLNNILTDFQLTFKYKRMIYEILPGPYCGLIRLMQKTLNLIPNNIYFMPYGFELEHQNVIVSPPDIPLFFIENEKLFHTNFNLSSSRCSNLLNKFKKMMEHYNILNNFDNESITKKVNKFMSETFNSMKNPPFIEFEQSTLNDFIELNLINTIYIQNNKLLIDRYNELKEIFGQFYSYWNELSVEDKKKLVKRKLNE
ncbi:hypothetical protein H311_02429 [Anncaliia algerae PRA109]|nr:hypothetical protein H311_02429 [Anncaliia algerae PRA109]